MITKFLPFPLFSFLLLPLTACAPSIEGTRQVGKESKTTPPVEASKTETVATPVTEENLLTRFVAALNTPEGKGLESFFKENATQSMPTAMRIKGAMSLVTRGAPFVIKRMISSEPGELKALVVDRAGIELGFSMLLDKSNPKLMEALRVGPPEAPAEPATVKNYKGWTTLQALVDQVREDTKLPALAVAVSNGGKVESVTSGVRVEGRADKVTNEEPFSTGSIGKSLCTTVIGKLVEMGKLNWSSTIGEVLSDLPMNPAYKNVTIDQLMQHRAGVRPETMMNPEQVDQLVAGESNPTKMRRRYAVDLLKAAPASKPGEKFAYSNGGYVILGAIAEKVTGKRYEDLVKDFIFKPLALSHSFTNVDSLPDKRPSGHIASAQGPQPENFTGPLEVLLAPAGGGMWMSATDLMKFGESHLKGLKGQDGILKAVTIQHLHKGIPEGDNKDREYACGWGIEHKSGKPLTHGHNGSNGTMLAYLTIVPKSNLVIAVFTNIGKRSKPTPPELVIDAIVEKLSAK